MYKICQTEASQERQYHIEDTLLAMMKEQPYADITVSALCTRADIPRKAFYRYFDTKEDVLYALLDHVQMRYLYAGPAGDTSYDEAERMFSFWYAHRELLDILIKNGMEGLWFTRMTDKAIEERVGAKYSQQKAPTFGYKLMTTFTIGGLLSCVIFWHRSGWRYTPQQMAKITGELLTSPLYDLHNRPPKQLEDL